jgi:hypothetical protein
LWNVLGRRRGCGEVGDRVEGERGVWWLTMMRE